MIVPMKWLIMKNWKNGKVVYDKREDEEHDAQASEELLSKK